MLTLQIFANPDSYRCLDPQDLVQVQVGSSAAPSDGSQTPGRAIKPVTQR